MPGTLVVKSDSSYVVDSVNKWIPGWANNGWVKRTGGKLQNLDEMKQLYQWVYVNNLPIKFHHVLAAHDRNQPTDPQAARDWYGNNQADKLAREGATK